MLISFILLIIAATGIAIFFSKNRYKTPGIAVDEAFLAERVPFFSSLEEGEKKKFVQDMQHFLGSVKITGIDVPLTPELAQLVAAGAVIPVFHLDNWEYGNLDEVLLYKDAFNAEFETSGPAERNIAGMVGEGFMQRKMILSVPAVLHSFENREDGHNVVIHEFVHLIDKTDGHTDGLPEVLMRNQYIIPWLDLVHAEIENIRTGDSEINSYGFTNRQEFFAVSSEYFFEKPGSMQKHHPELFEALQKIFKTKIQ